MACASGSSYHHGITIKEFRIMRGMTQEGLAAFWPKSNGNDGIRPRYIQDVEYGKKHIDYPNTLRRLAEILQIPLWRFGLSEYDPFHPHSLVGSGKSLHHQMLDAIESLIQQTWNLRCAARLVDAERGIERLNSLFGYFREHVPPSLRLEKRFQLLYAQMQRLNAVTYVEKKRYDEGLDMYRRMYETAQQSDDASLMALALMSQGWSSNAEGKRRWPSRGWKKRAMPHLEQASKSLPSSTAIWLVYMRVLVINCALNVPFTLREPWQAASTGATEMGHNMFSGERVPSWQKEVTVIWN